MTSAPSHLTVYLSGICNFRCGYCRSRFPGPPIARPRLLAGLDSFLALPGAGKKVSFLGGEPLLHPALLRAAVERLRSKGGPALPLQLFTNGALLTRSMAAFLARNGVRVVVSVDGAPDLNDAARRPASGAASAFRSALRAARLCGGAAASMVVTPAGARRLASSLAALRAAGFKSLAWAPDVSALWDRGGLRALRAGAAEAAALYLGELAAGEAWEVANIYELLALRRGQGLPACSNITLAPDGCFYPCDKLLSGGLKAAAPFRCGPDGAGKRKFFGLAAAAGARSSQVLCPVAPWALGRFSAGGGPGYLAGQAAARRIAGAWLSKIAAAGRRHRAFRAAHGLEESAA